MKYDGINMSRVKLRNRSAILTYIMKNGPVSRKELASVTGLTAAAVSLISAELIEEGILKETGIVAAGSAGRRQVLLDIDSGSRIVLTINLESRQTVIALVNLRGGLLGRHSMQTDCSLAPELFLKKIARAAKTLLQKHPETAGRVAGAAVGITGIVDRAAGISRQAYGIWKEEVPVCAILKEQLGLPVILENNVNAFAEAELLYGSEKDYDNLLVIKWGPGVGSAMIIDNRIYEGRHNKAAELGHFIVEKNGRLCSCGRHGCLETKVSWQALQEKRDFSMRDFGTVLQEAEQEGTADFYLDAIDLFARAIVNTMTIVAPNRVILYGSLFYGKAVRDRLIEDCMSYDPGCSAHRIVYSELTGKEDYIGPAACMITRELIGGGEA